VWAAAPPALVAAPPVLVAATEVVEYNPISAWCALVSIFVFSVKLGMYRNKLNFTACFIKLG